MKKERTTTPYKITKLTAFMRLATPAEREYCAEKAGTSVAYLYQLAGLHRLRPGVAKALGIERATTELHTTTNGRLPIVTMADLAMAHEDKQQTGE